jgi:hypothetical protein
MWHAITETPDADSDLRLAVINSGEVHALVFPCRRNHAGWVDAESGRLVEVLPTHWQYWSDDPLLQRS